jgi:hypothetical protein
MFLLYTIIFNFYTLVWEPFPLIAPEQYDRLDSCVVRMNEINRSLEQNYSAVRAVCEPIKKLK